MLVVEDEPALRAGLLRMLRKRGAHAAEARSGAEALDLATRELPEVVILDLGLPDMSGLEVCRGLRSRRDTARVPILVLTGASEVAAHVGALRAGADDFVTKPCHPMVLEARLGNLVRRLRAERENERLVSDLERYVSLAARAQAIQPRSFERMRATIFFSDLRDSTAASFAGEPRAYAEAVGMVLGRQADIVRHWGGYVDKFTGDGMLAVFPDDRGPHQAVRAADEIVRWASRSHSNRIWSPLPIGIGIHEGLVLRGDVGSSERRDFTVIGPTVNTAARLCGRAGALDVLVSEPVRRQAEADLHFVEVPLLALKGLPQPLQAWRLVLTGTEPLPAPVGGPSDAG